MLKLQFRDRRRESVWLVDQTFTIGKAASNSLMIDDSSVHDFHVEIVNNHDQLMIVNLVDTESSETLRLNGKVVNSDSTLKAKDVITIGNIELELIDPKSLVEQQHSASTTNYSNGWSIYSSASWLDQNRFMIDKKTVIGRDASCDITLPLEHLSRKHVTLEVKNGQLHIQDLDSSNGTFLNGKQVKQSSLKTGDKIKLDVLTFEVSGPAHDPNKTIIRTAPLQNESKPTATSAKIAPKPKAQAKKPEQASKAKISSQNGSKNTNKAKPHKKRLASDGKQEWISGNNKTNQNAKRKTSRTMAISFTLLIAGTVGLLAYMFMK